MHDMKKIIYLLFAVFMLTAAAGCRRASHNGSIDGNWRLVQVEILSTGEIIETDPENEYFIAINLELMQLRGRGITTNPFCTGIMDYDRDAGRLAVDFPNKPPMKQLAEFGIFENPVVFQVEEASHKALVLRTPQSVITCRRF